MLRNIFPFRRRGVSGAPRRSPAPPPSRRPDRVPAEAAQVLLDAQREAIDIRRQADADVRREKQRLSEIEGRLIEREERLDQKLNEIETKAHRLQEKAQETRAKEEDIARLERAQRAKLAELSGITAEEAERRVIAETEARAQQDLVRRMRALEASNREALEKRANEILASVIQRYAASHVSETTTSVVHLPNDDMKGRIIGKEGRNIRVLENVTGCEIIVDETPGTITVSGFSPLRRQVARVAIERLVEDGRIQPARIEEIVARAKKEVAKSVREAGEEAVYDLGITEFDPHLVQLIGRLKFRTSYGQSVLQHSWEAARIAAMLAEELGADVNVAKRATLLHDIGKAVDHEVEGNHVEIGISIMRKFGIPEPIIKTAAAHHEEYPYESIEAVIVQVADAISASRPGARRESYEQYVRRMEDLERIASSFAGVHKAYAIAAGREVRVFVEPQKVDDLTAIKLSQDIARRIERELQYPGEVKVNVIRELRTEATAK